jgi:glycosyltransferase involved in cell wall biosynthesis
MRILYHHRTRATDAQRIHILEMVRAFRALGHEVEIAALAGTETPRLDAKEQAREAGWKRLARKVPLAYEAVLLGSNIIGMPLLLWKIRSARPAFLYERYSLFNFSGVVAARLCGKPIVLEVNSPLAYEQRQEKGVRAFRLAAWMERRILNAATRVVAVSTPLRRMLVEGGVEASKISVLPNGVSFNQGSAADPARLRASLGLEGKVVIGFVGWFKKWHGLELLVRAFHQSGLSGGAALLLLGDGPAMSELRRQICELGLEQHVILPGAVAHEQVFAYLDLIDIAVQPAANPYCCPMKILEYMALAKPIIAPRQENIQELLEEGREAELFTPGSVQALSQALRTLANDSSMRARLGNQSFQAIARRGFLWTKNAEAVTELLRPWLDYQSFSGNSGEAKASPKVTR